MSTPDAPVPAGTPAETELRRKLIDAIVIGDACGSVRSFQSGYAMKVVADDLADLVLPVFRREVASLRAVVADATASGVPDSGRPDCELTSYADLADIVENLAFLVREKRRERRMSARAVAAETGLCSSTMTRLDQGKTVSSDGLVALLRWMEGGHE